MVEDRSDPMRCFNRFAIALVLIISNVQQIICGPSPQQEHELLLLDALSRKQINNNLNAISTANNYESNAIMDMLGRSMLLKRTSRIQNFILSLSLPYGNVHITYLSGHLNLFLI